MERIKTYPSLNGLRAISILIVIFAHLGDWNYWPFFNINFANQHKYTLWAPFCFILQDGQLAVNIFFIISGFLITSLLLSEEQKKSTISLKRFWIKRVLRIFPAFYFLLLFYFILQTAGVIHIDKTSWLTALTYTTSFYKKNDWLTTHFWSLSVEEIFYFFWPICFLLGNSMRRYACFFIIAFVCCMRVYVHRHPVSWIDNLSPFTRLDAIAIGCLIALYIDEILKLLKPYLSTLLYVAIVLLLLMPYVRLGSSVGLISNLSVSIILLYSVFGSTHSLWYRFLNSKAMNYTGILSYSLYLWQEFFIYPHQNFWFRQFPQNLVCIAFAALLSYYCIEKPFLQLKKKF